jgi:Down syndrome cell adhesion molecule
MVFLNGFAVPPRWTVEPNDQSAVLGHSILLDCQADGFPNPATNWKQAVGEFLSGYLLIR